VGKLPTPLLWDVSPRNKRFASFAGCKGNFKWLAAYRWQAIVSHTDFGGAWLNFTLNQPQWNYNFSIFYL